MKPQTAIHLIGGDILRVKEPLDDMTAIWANMHRSQPGSVYAVTQITGHGTEKRGRLLAGTILRLEEL